MLKHQMELVNKEIAQLVEELGADAIELAEHFTELDSIDMEQFSVPLQSIPIRCDVRTLPWKKLGLWCQFDVVMMDPPWQLASKAPTRGVALGYSQLPNREIMDMPIPLIQSNGFIFIWVINSRYSFALEMMQHWGYEFVDDITWVKSTVNGRLAKGHGFYLQHAKESCLVGMKGNRPESLQGNISPDVIVSQRRGQSQKPEEIYKLIETLVPDGLIHPLNFHVD
mmetsp:Transcript_13151/g.16490  ORF Transcript_13151/g.16490 Transcript_13151/m.16490 type:complete len:225 (+) Transcript_13151:2011-2685(+)